MRIDPGSRPWEPAEGARLEEAWHVWDYPRWGYFSLSGARFAFHRHENVGAYDRGPSLWTYRPIDEAGLAGLTLPQDQWGEPWSRAHDAWRARTPACWWAVVDHELHVVRSGELAPGTTDDLPWAEAFAAAEGIEGRPEDD